MRFTKYSVGSIKIFRTGSIGLILTILLSYSSAQGTWERLNVPVIRTLRSVCFVDSLYGWIAGDSGTILHTEDGGVNWNFQNTQSVNDIYEIVFLDRERGWASSYNFTTPPYGTVILKTIDGGIEWISSPYPDDNIFINCILFTDSLNGWMGGSPHALVRTNDGGTSWAQAAIDTSTLAFFPVLGITFYDENYGYACGGMFDIAGVIWRTWNGGEMWYAIDVSDAPADEVHGLYTFDSVNVMGAGGDPDFGYGVGMIRTSDGGVNWDYEELDIQGNAYDLDFRNDHEAWAPLGPKRKFIYSLDTGATWTEINTPGLTAIFDVAFPDSMHGFAVGREGVVLKYNPPGPVKVDEELSPEKDDLALQNYPNPFSDVTVIRFTVPANHPHNTVIGIQKVVLLKVFDLYGKDVAILVNDKLLPGEYNVSFDASRLPDGIYYCHMEILPEYGGRITTAIKMLRR